MGILNLERDYEYFSSIWEYKSEKKHSSQMWDERAADWKKELKKDNSFQYNLEERVSEAAAYLRAHGLLGAGSQVVDIGCGLGRFVTEFAKTSGHVTGVDISEKMLELGKEYAAECGVDNVTFMKVDLNELDVDAFGWGKQFDLVFTSITPAIGTMKNLEKLNRISRGYCFNSSIVRWEDTLANQIAREAFRKERAAAPGSDGKRFYALLNLLWLQGYLPETHYHCQLQKEYVDLDEDLIRYYSKCVSEDMLSPEDNMIPVSEYLKKHVNSDGKILRTYERWYGWILWDVRKRMSNGFK